MKNTKLQEYNLLKSTPRYSASSPESCDKCDNRSADRGVNMEARLQDTLIMRQFAYMNNHISHERYSRFELLKMLRNSLEKLENAADIIDEHKIVTGYTFNDDEFASKAVDTWRVLVAHMEMAEPGYLEWVREQRKAPPVGRRGRS